MPTIDYAKKWRTESLPVTGLIPTDVLPENRREYWSAIDGPWRQFFLKLHTAIRDKFGETDDMAASNAWGTTRSNLFNLISLSILSSDYFAFLTERRYDLKDWTEMDESIQDWIGDLNPIYFSRDWRMRETKKDQPIIRKAWAETWHEYRVMRDRLPRVERYNPGGG